MPTKLIEVALPLDAINIASAKEKSIRHGHPSTLHLWWARRPLAACRAVLFASLVDDPSAHPEKFKTESEQDAERERLFEIIRDLVKWENSSNTKVLESAHAEIRKSCGDKPPPVLDPFCGGGSIPLEAQRLGLEAHASDLNPVPVLITKALIEIPPKFAGHPPINSDWQKKSDTEQSLTPWVGAKGLAEDVRWYGQWMRSEAERQVGHLYPKVKVTKDLAKVRPELKSKVGQELTVIAWLWARTVECPNPACKAQMPLVKSFCLIKKSNVFTYINPIPEPDLKRVRFTIQTGSQPPSGTISRKGARCLCCSTPVSFDHIRSEGKAGRLNSELMGIVVAGPGGRAFLPPDADHVAIAREAVPTWVPETELAHNPFSLRPPLYGLRTFAQLFTSRQLVALNAFCCLVHQARDRVLADAKSSPRFNGTTAEEYANAVAVYLALGVSRLTDMCNALCMWENTKAQVRHLFTRQAIPMLWDYAEPNVFGDVAGDFGVSLNTLSKVIERLGVGIEGVCEGADATELVNGSAVVSTDPPYYNNIDYADLSDFFYVWLRRCLHPFFPSHFATMSTPKTAELVASQYRFGGDKDKAREHFVSGLGRAFHRMMPAQNPDYPMTVYYAYKQTEADDSEEAEESGSEVGHTSTGWETMLEGLIDAQLTITGTWPMRTELSNRPMANKMNSLATSVVIVCRRRPIEARQATRREFLSALKRELPDALKKLQRGNIAPVDLSQAAIGPGMAIYSRFKQVIESDGKPMPVRTALQLINQALDEVLSEQDSEYDSHTRFAVAWFEQYALGEGPFGDADVMARAKDCALNGLVQAGVLSSRAGKVRLLKRDELATDWSPTGRQPYVWEATQHLIRALEKEGEAGTATVLRAIGGIGEIARDLAYRLYNTCEKKKWAEEARAYNGLVIAWPEVNRLSRQQPSLPKGKAKPSLFEDTDDE